MAREYRTMSGPDAPKDKPIPMILYCPSCGMKHIDEPNEAKGWTNPPHRSHECQHCGVVWRPADVATVGVHTITTKGKVDTWDAQQQIAAMVEDVVNFYEREFYVLSNFASFTFRTADSLFATSEHYYHFLKFEGTGPVGEAIQTLIRQAPSAHEAYKVAERYKSVRREDWDTIQSNDRRLKVNIMKDILHRKADQHEYVARKLEETGTRVISELSWRDDFWGTGPNGDGADWMGKLWMEVRDERRKRDTPPPLIPNRPEVVAGLMKPIKVAPTTAIIPTTPMRGKDDVEF